MANIFDDNSEFKQYLGNKPLKKQKAKKSEPTPPKSEEPHAQLDIEPEATPQAPAKKVVPSGKVSAFKLDLSSHAVKPHAENYEENEATSESEPKPQPTKIPKAPRSKAYEVIMENVRTLMYGTIIFLIGYLALNWSAYYEVGTGLYYELTGQEQNPILRTFTDNVPVDEVIQTDVGTEVISSIPAFDMEITPPGTRIIIPRLGKNVPVVNVPETNLVKRDWEALENDLQSALRGGVVHYPGTPWPGQSGNVVLTGHSSYYAWDPGRFKDVFAVLHNLNLGDEIIVFHNQRKFRYIIDQTEVVLPQQVEILGDTGDDRLTLLTCTPIGTNLKRLIVTAKPIET